MTFDRIKTINVPSIAAPDCVLFLWATQPTLPQALDVMSAWGFSYKTGFVWVKNHIGLGFWCRNRHELLLLGARGNVPAPAHGTQWDSVIEATRGRHSEKPLIIYDLIESYYPTLPKIELFARSVRPGFDCWGAEAPT
jgi:N6-adenosine-specific RNA methylase IME4